MMRIVHTALRRDLARTQVALAELAMSRTTTVARRSPPTCSG